MHVIPSCSKWSQNLYCEEEKNCLENVITPKWTCHVCESVTCWETTKKTFEKVHSPIKKRGHISVELQRWQYSKPGAKTGRQMGLDKSCQGSKQMFERESGLKRKEVCTGRQADTTQKMELPEPLPYYISPHQNTITRNTPTGTCRHTHLHTRTLSRLILSSWRNGSLTIRQHLDRCAERMLHWLEAKALSCAGKTEASSPYSGNLPCQPLETGCSLINRCAEMKWE